MPEIKLPTYDQMEEIKGTVRTSGGRLRGDNGDNYIVEILEDKIYDHNGLDYDLSIREQIKALNQDISSSTSSYIYYPYKVDDEDNIYIGWTTTGYMVLDITTMTVLDADRFRESQKFEPYTQAGEYFTLEDDKYICLYGSSLNEQPNGSYTYEAGHALLIFEKLEKGVVLVNKIKTASTHLPGSNTPIANLLFYNDMYMAIGMSLSPRVFRLDRNPSGAPSGITYITTNNDIFPNVIGSGVPIYQAVTDPKNNGYIYAFHRIATGHVIVGKHQWLSNGLTSYVGQGPTISGVPSISNMPSVFSYTFIRNGISYAFVHLGQLMMLIDLDTMTYRAHIGMNSRNYAFNSRDLIFQVPGDRTESNVVFFRNRYCCNIARYEFSSGARLNSTSNYVLVSHIPVNFISGKATSAPYGISMNKENSFIDGEVIYARNNINLEPSSTITKFELRDFAAEFVKEGV